ncbi:MAG: hypothetical protein BGN82_09465 [Alphaproteobacteria bacterium 65-7]|nr:MAG: hypothetical protein BGN82_09465 [Alphaproteobacteria bacterium 65-7]
MGHETKKHDLRDGVPSGALNTAAELPGYVNPWMPLPSGGEHEVNPGTGSRAGMAEGQVTKSN